MGFVVDQGRRQGPKSSRRLADPLSTSCASYTERQKATSKMKLDETVGDSCEILTILSSSYEVLGLPHFFFLLTSTYIACSCAFCPSSAHQITIVLYRTSISPRTSMSTSAFPNKAAEARPDSPSHTYNDGHSCACRHDLHEAAASRDSDQPFLPRFNRKFANPSPAAFLALALGLFSVSIVALGTDHSSTLTIIVAVSFRFHLAGVIPAY